MGAGNDITVGNDISAANHISGHTVKPHRHQNLRVLLSTTD